MLLIFLAAAMAALPLDCALQFGCTTRANLAAMLADPNDLVSGRALVPTPETEAVNAIERLRRGKPFALPGASSGADDAAGAPQ
jgi:type IV pilus biogenesis protein CpaD/CtpE